MGRRRFAPGWQMSAFAALLLPLTVSLGFWQLDRAEQKLALETAFYERAALPPVTPPADPAGSDFLRVRLSGRYRPGQDFLVDNRTDAGRPGYWVVSSFDAEDGRRWLVNRGWLEGPAMRDALPRIPAVAERVNLVGVIWPDTGLPPLLAADDWSGDWPKRVQRLDVERMAAAVGGVEPVEVRLEPGYRGVLKPAPLEIEFAPERHQGYAVQWFGLALVLAVGYLIFGFTQRPERR